MTPTFGDFLALAGRHIDGAARSGGDLPATALGEVIGELGRVITALARFTGAFTNLDGADPAAVQLLDPLARAAADMRLALRQAAASLPEPPPPAAGPAADVPHPAAGHLRAAVGALGAGHDLLQAHFLPGPEGSRIGGTRWAPVIVSPPVTRALLAEAAAQAFALAPWVGQLAARAAATGTLPMPAALAVDAAGQWLRRADTIARSALLSHPATEGDRRLLAAIPASIMPSRAVVGGGETLHGLCAGVATAAERLRHLAAASRRDGSAAAASSACWQRTAHAAAIALHNGESILRSLAGRSGELALSRDIAGRLRDAADAARDAWQAWRAVARRFDTITTGPDATLTAVAAETSDLALWTGRLAHDDPQWTPARGHTSPGRPPGQLVPAAADVPAVGGAVHAAADAISRAGAADRDAVHAAAASTCLYMPTRLLPARYDIPYRFTQAFKPAVDELMICYGTAVDISGRAATLLDDIAAALGAPTRLLAVTRAAERRGVPHLLHQADQLIQVAPAIEPAPGHLQQALRNLGITEPGLLERAVAIDDATRDLMTEAIVKTQRRSLATAEVLASTQAATGPPAHLAAKDSPNPPTGQSTRNASAVSAPQTSWHRSTPAPARAAGSARIPRRRA
jgi:hypothetical protein